MGQTLGLLRGGQRFDSEDFQSEKGKDLPVTGLAIPGYALNVNDLKYIQILTIGAAKVLSPTLLSGNFSH